MSKTLGLCCSIVGSTALSCVSFTPSEAAPYSFTLQAASEVVEYYGDLGSTPSPSPGDVANSWANVASTPAVYQGFAYDGEDNGRYINHLFDIEDALTIGAGGSLRSIHQTDPWMYFQYELTNFSGFELFYALDLRLDTERTAGPTVKDTFLHIELFDTNNDGFVRTNSTYAEASVIEDNGGPLIVHQDGLGFSAPPGGADYVGEGVYTEFDETGTGPNSDDVAGASGYNKMRFLYNSYLSPYDTVRLTGFACYAATASLCPSRAVLGTLDLDDPFTTAAVPLPAPLLAMLSALGSLWMLRQRR